MISITCPHCGHTSSYARISDPLHKYDCTKCKRKFTRTGTGGAIDAEAVSCQAQTDWMNNPANPANPASPLNPINQQSYSSPAPSYSPPEPAPSSNGTESFSSSSPSVDVPSSGGFDGGSSGT